jgi:hypothetical protein
MFTFVADNRNTAPNTAQGISLSAAPFARLYSGNAGEVKIS